MRISEYNAPIAENIERIINEKGLKKAFVAQKAGCTAQMLSDMISGRKIIKAYGFVIPLAPYLHEFQKGSVHDNPNHGLDLELKQMAQRYFEEHIGSREEFREVFGKSWL